MSERGISIECGMALSHSQSFVLSVFQSGTSHPSAVCATGHSVFQFLHSGFGGLEVECWPLVPKFAGSNPAEAHGLLRVNKNPQHVGGHGCLSVVIVVCCQVVSATN